MTAKANSRQLALWICSTDSATGLALVASDSLKNNWRSLTTVPILIHDTVNLGCTWGEGAIKKGRARAAGGGFIKQRKDEGGQRRGQSYDIALIKHTSSSDTNDARTQSQPDEGSVRMGSNVDKDDVRMGSGVDKDDVRLGSHVDKVDPRVALDTDKDVGDQARPCPKWASDAGCGAGCSVTPAVRGMDAWRAAVPPPQCDRAGASRVLVWL
ncbi:hypothetical protein K438DRAFT_1993173 [Mycena galopus ATCC 62051]|nr:hypothetical protein K438DRAFT_1993173 [Mycena galopus ATCC 62051]